MIKRVAVFVTSALLVAAWLLGFDHVTGVLTTGAGYVVTQTSQASACSMIIDQSTCLDTSHIIDSRDR